MRITGGELKNIRIKVPQGIRPTQDNVRQAIFNILGEKIKGKKFVDLFAGSGAVGIDALSRGAEKTTFVDNSRKVIKILKENLETIDYSAKAEIVVKDARNILIDDFDILFADPPYDKGYLIKVLNNYLPAEQTGKSKKCILILEHSKYEVIEIGRNYNFGDAVLTFIESGF